MAKFDTSALAAVTEFFGNDNNDNGTTNGLNESSRTDPHKRSGVGAVPKPKTGSLSAAALDLTSKKLLRVGSKRRRDDNDDDDGDEREKVNDDGNDTDDDEGRTAIQEKPRAVRGAAVAVQHTGATDSGVVAENAVDTSNAVTTTTTTKKKKKKKKGKKERQRDMEKQQDQPNGEGMTTTDSASTIPKTQSMDGTKNTTTVPTDTTNNDNNDDGTPMSARKRKRRKVRSRQKNIYKDHREQTNKPEHLRMGHKSYSGRPMTKETRTRLNLPEPQPKHRIHYDEELNIKTGEAVGTMTGRLAIDDILDTSGGNDGFGVKSGDDGGGDNDDGPTQDESKATCTSKPKKKATKKKRKKKYKNL